LNPHSCIKVGAFNDYGKQVRESLEISFGRAQQFVESFREFLIFYWKNS
jgi:hypothetical protein